MASEPRPAGARAALGGFRRFLQRGGDRAPSGIAGAAGIVALGFLGSRLLGLLRSVAIADAFGTDPELGAYWVAFRLPDLVFQLLAGATLSAAFIPVFSRVSMHQGPDRAWLLASRVLNLVSIATVVVAAAAFVAAPWLVPVLAPGLGETSGREAELRDLAIELTRLMLLSPIFFGISGMLMGILNARQHFIAPALAPMVYNVSIIFGAVFLAGPYGVHGLVWGVVIGSVGHLLIQLPALRSVGMRWTPSIDLGSEAVREVLRLMGPRVIGLGASQINFLVLVFFASFVSDEAISAVNYAFLMMMLPVGVVGMAVATAAFPIFSQQAAAGRLDALRNTVWRSLRAVLFLAVPASAGLVVLAKPMVQLLLERGAFDIGSTDLVASTLVLFGIGVFAHAGIEILSRGFYALEDTRTPVQVAVMAMVLNVVLALILVRPFELRGLAAAASITAILEFLVLTSLLRGRIGGFDRRGLGDFSARLALATVAMVQVMVLMRLLLGALGIDISGALGATFLVLTAGLLGVLTFGAAAITLLGDEYRQARRALRL
ncbi:MAG: murein biosynthesis integral membrane protein MurJ [Chloroflexi bacterium]|nr:murein biosynthesis integral membrane protein MurJ [Chloroflexota bacterium]MDA1146747.1 murein biosynthesis integral membrane protein MurJ [Chloroflexota bacterium]MQC82884.1 murein biosynthesis integral membrane protein MurJ [Chloroflexota bacterium]